MGRDFSLSENEQALAAKMRQGLFGVSMNHIFIPELPIKPPTADRNILTQFRRSGRGILKGAAFRQRPFVTDDEIVCGYQRIFRPDCAV